VDSIIDRPLVTIVVLNWNGRDDTLECLASVCEIEYSNYEIVVVDNGSTDGSVPAIKEKFSTLTVLETGRNLGYAGGNNVGIQAALRRGAEFVLLLNNDTIVAPDLIDEFIKAARQFPNAGAFCGKIYRYEDPHRIWWADAQWVKEEGNFVCPSEGVLDNAAAEDGAKDTDYACGCAIFIRSALIREAGPLDSLFFLTFEETDWCFRVRRLGYRCLYIPKAKIWHKGSVSFKGDDSPLYSYFFTRNRLLFAERHLSMRARAIVWWITIRQVFAWTFAPLRGTSANWKERYWLIRSWLRHLDCWWRNPGFWATRLAIRDYLLRRFGDCPLIVRELNRVKL
jgi:GT2 family glycosyltransferase